MALNKDIREIKELEKHLFADYLQDWIQTDAEFTISDPLSVSVDDLLQKIKSYIGDA